jgi:hypothetical protein
MPESYEDWMKQVRAALDSLDMPMANWQAIGRFDYRSEYAAGVKPEDAALKANRLWWLEWHKSLKQDCQETPDCWLPRSHQGRCEPIPPLAGAAEP